MKGAIINSCCGKELYAAQIPEGYKDPGEMDIQQIIDSIIEVQLKKIGATLVDISKSLDNISND